MTLIRPELTRSGNLDHWLLDFFWNEHPFHGFWGLSPRANGESSADTDRSRAYVAADFYEDAEAFHAVMELPGVSRENVDVELENSVLRITGKHTDKFGDNERSFEFTRSLAIPEGVDGSKISAEMKDGLLFISMPKNETVMPRAIEVK